MKERLTGTMEVKRRSLIRGKRGTIMGVTVPRYPTRAQPRERGGKSSSLGLHGRSSIANEIPIYGQGVTLPSPNKVQNAANQSFRWNEGPRRPPKHL